MNATALWVCMLAAGGVHAAGLKELLEAAERNNFDRRLTLEQREKAAADVNGAWSGLLPNLTVQGSWSHNQYPVEIQIGPQAPVITITPKNQFDAVVRFELPLIDTSRWFRASAAGLAQDAAEARDGAVRDAVRRQVATTYYAYAAALAVRDSAKKSLGVAQAALSLQEIRLNLGSATELEVLRARAEVERNKQTLADTEALVANTRRALLTLSGMDPGETAQLPEDNLSQEGALADLEAKAAQLPGIQAAELDAEAAGKAARATKFALVPVLNAHFTERITNATGFNGQPASYVAGVNLLWRVDGPNLFNIKSQGALASSARLLAQRQRAFSRDQVHSDWQRLNAAIQKVTAARAQVEAAQRAAQVTRDRYTVGATTQFEVIQSERDLFGAEVNQIQARTELASSHVAVRLSAGLPLGVE